MKNKIILEKIFRNFKNKNFYISDGKQKFHGPKINLLIKEKLKLIESFNLKGNSIAVLKNNCGSEYWINLLVALKLNFTIFPEIKKSNIYKYYKNIVYLNGKKIKVVKNKNIKKNNIINKFNLIFSSSGSTGDPKLILQKISFVCKNAQYVLKKIKFKKNKTFLMCIPYLFTSAICHFFACMISGTNFISIEKIMLPSNIKALLKRKKINYFGGPPLHSKWVIESTNNKLINFEKMISSGDFLAEDTINEYLKRKLNFDFYYMYGLSEVGGRFCINLIKNNEYKFFVGRPLNYMKIIKNSSLKGEIKIKSNNLYLGYYQKNNFALQKSTIYNTGDVGILRNNYLKLEGRMSEIFKSSGVMIFPQLIKKKLLNTKWFDEILIYKGNVKSFGNVPFCAFVSKKKIYPNQINDYLKNKIPSSHLPKKYFQLAKFPRLGNNKIDKQYIINKYQ